MRTVHLLLCSKCKPIVQTPLIAIQPEDPLVFATERMVGRIRIGKSIGIQISIGKVFISW